MTDDHRQFERRKEDHIKLSLMPENQTQDLGAYEQIALVHEAIPDINFNEIDISTQRFGKVQAKPFIVSSMTAGHQQAKFINRHLVEACALSGWGMGVGSQRRELLDPAAAFEWTDLRRDFPKVSLYSNLGIAQVIITPLDDIRRLTDALNAEALKPFTAKDVYLTFSTILLSDAAKEAFFKQFYLSHPLTKEEFNTPETIALYRQFLRNFMIVEGKKSFSDRFAKFTIALRGENPQELVTKLQNFLTVLNQQTFENLSEIINKQKAVLISTLEHQLTAEQATAQQKIRDQIQSLEHQLRDLQAYEDDPFTPQQDGPAWIEVKIDNLRAQLKHGANTPKIRELQGQVRYYQNLTIDAQKTIVFHIDGAIKTPVVPVLPQPRLTLMVGATSGFLLGILLILFQLAWRKERSLIKPLFEQPA